MEGGDMYVYSEQDKKAFKDFLNNHQTFLFLGPKNIDGDTVGANVALAMYVEQQLGKRVILFTPNPLAKMYLHFPWAERFVTSFDPDEVDAIFSSDTATEQLFVMSDEEREVLKKGLPWVNLDHHISNTFYGSINLIDTTMASCTMIVYKLLKEFGAAISPEMATHMVLGIYFDTGGLKHPNTTPETYHITSDLVRLGADLHDISQHLFHTTSIGKLKLLGKILTRAHINDDGVLISAVTQGDIDSCGATREDLEGVIDYLNAVPDKKFCMLLSEDGKGNVKGSLRTQEYDVDVNRVAQNFGGGGHKMAAGFTLSDHHLEPEVKWKIKPKTE